MDMFLRAQIAARVREQQQSQWGMFTPSPSRSVFDFGTTLSVNFPVTQRAPQTVQIRAAQTSPVQRQTGSLLEDIIKLVAEIGWTAYKAEWERISPDSRKAFDFGAKLTTSPSVTPSGQKFGVGLCALAFLVGLKDIDEASDD